MPRPAERFPPHIALHVTRRGRGRAECFFGERDRTAFLRWLGRYAARFGCSVHAYALMGNHVHLLVTADRANGVAALMDALRTRHERYASEWLGRPCRLWDEDFEATAIHVRRHFLACMRYIEWNPVHARLARLPGAYRWSSHRANALGEADPLLTPHPYYYALGRTPSARQAAYRRLFDGQAAGPRLAHPGSRDGNWRE
jgi:putative transposase